MKLAVVFAALVSAFTFSSCLNGGESGPNQYLSMVTIGSGSMGIPMLYPDESPNQYLLPSAIDLTKYGIKDGTTRAMISYTIPEGQDMTAKQIKIDLIAGQEWVVNKITNRLDTCADYKSPITAFTNYQIGYSGFRSANIAKDQYLNLGYSYRANKIGKVALAPNRVSNDTIYLDLKMKTEGTDKTSGTLVETYDLYSAYNLFQEVTPLKDSVYVTVLALTSEYGESAKKDSVTARCKSRF